MAKKSGMKLIANNKKAFHDYFIEDTYEAGIALVGTEVKSLRAGKCSVKESWKTGKYTFTGCISVLMRRETFLTKIL